MSVDLLKILPSYFRPVREFQEIMKTHGAALDNLEMDLYQLYSNLYIQTADASTLKIYEELFGIQYKPGEPLDYRRQRILQLYNTFPPFSEGFLRSRLEEMFGKEYSLDINEELCKIIVLVTSSKYGAVDLLYSLIWDIVPAHMEVIANHQVTNIIHGKLYVAGITESTLIQTI